MADQVDKQDMGAASDRTRPDEEADEGSALEEGDIAAGSRPDADHENEDPVTSEYPGDAEELSEIELTDVVGDSTWVMRGITKVVSVNADVARAHIRRFGGGATGVALLRRLDMQYRAALTGSGAAVGASAIAPGVGTGVALVLTGGEFVAALEATMIYILAYAEVHGVDLDDISRRRALLLAILLGKSGEDVITTVVGRTGRHWARKVVESVPLAAIRRVNRILGRNFLTRYGTRQGIVVLGRVVPFGVGVVLGAAGGLFNAQLVVLAARRAFGPLEQDPQASHRESQSGRRTWRLAGRRKNVRRGEA